MKHIDMAEATRLTRAGKLDEAMAVLRGDVPAQGSPEPADENGFVEMVQLDGKTWTAAFDANATTAAKPRKSQKPKVSLADMVARHLPAGKARGFSSTDMSVPAGAEFTKHSFSGATGSRSYKLYVPSTYSGVAMPLIVMLHGCTQSPDDFAAGTQMNLLAEAHGFLVAYPGQDQAANMNRCWNWFNSADQARDVGEPAIIAGITRQIMASHSVDAKRIFVAGLSAGGAMAAIMGASYPDLYSGVGVHSGLPVGAAKDMPTAFAAMSQGAGAAHTLRIARAVHMIVFHGDADKTVSSENAKLLIRQGAGPLQLTEEGRVGKDANGRGYHVSRYIDKGGDIVMENWTIHGAGHAWAGGSTKGNFTDPSGPDASSEMVRFFLARTT